MSKKVVLGLSGGVDSSVAAYLLKKQGYEVIGLFMINWKETTGTLTSNCSWEDDITFAKLVAKQLDIEFHSIDLSNQYRKRVVDYIFSEYEKGKTPNPDVLCNREIKFDAFFDAAKEFNADYFATGHYCRKETEIVDGKEVHKLLAGIDGNKDQSYFLCQLNQEQLSKALFPIGDMIKPDVRKIADDMELASAKKKDSQGICFVGKVDLPEFLKQKIAPCDGKIIEIPKDVELRLENYRGDDLDKLSSKYIFYPEQGKVVGKHNGAHNFTIGQRRGLNVGGTAEPLFVIGVDVENNIVYTGQGKDHPGLSRKGLFIKNEDIHWIREDIKMDTGESRDYMVRIRYRQKLNNATLHRTDKGLYIIFEEPQTGITLGQFAAWYSGDELMGSGVID